MVLTAPRAVIHTRQPLKILAKVVLVLEDEAHVATALGVIARKGRNEMNAYRSDGLNNVSSVFSSFFLHQR